MKIYNYIEIAIDTPRKRGVFIPKQELAKHINSVPLYRSMYLYNEDAYDYGNSKNTIKHYYGPRSIDNILIDIDREQNTDKFTLDKMQGIVYKLINDLELSPENFRVYFSGTGYHIIIPNSVFNFTASEDLPFHMKETMMKLFPEIDPMVYTRTGLYRVAHTINKKTGLYKVPLTYKEAVQCTWQQIHDLAKTARTEFPYEELVGDGELEDHIVEASITSKPMGKVSEPNKVVTCVQRMYGAGPQVGSRHTTLLRIVSHYRRSGISSRAAKAALLEWNDGSLNEQEVVSQVEYAYNKGYQYGCQDHLMKEHCNPKCIHYKRKDYLVDIMDNVELQKQLTDRLTTDFTGKSYNLGKALGVEADCQFYPGDLITIFGPTGSSKTTLAQNIALGYDHLNDRIDTNLQIPTLYLSLELAGWYMHRRNLQIASNQSKDNVSSNYQSIYPLVKDKVAHITIQTVAPTLEQIQTKITELQPAMVIVDYIDLVDTPPSVRGEYEQIKYISHGLSNMAVNNDLIIIQVSQVSRDYSRNEVLDLYAGKGSGAIENASRKVIGLNGQADSPKKAVKLFKNTDGELFETELEWTPSFRLRRTDGY
ncbi:MAG: putative ATP-dependent helicase [Prokaryotic dsDNA virus sp.]|nr:MAG: putative ATP-dependent helicase [Prokaryotic dsDNA virus sp.]